VKDFVRFCGLTALVDSQPVMPGSMFPGRTIFEPERGGVNTRHVGIRHPWSHLSSYTSILGDI